MAFGILQNQQSKHPCLASEQLDSVSILFELSIFITKLEGLSIDNMSAGNE